jgi:N utilization substance protein A
MNREFIDALDDLEKEKHIPKSVLLEAIESALVAAYKKNYGTTANIRVDVNEVTGEVAVLSKIDVVDEITDEATQMTLAEAQEIDPRYEVGDYIEFEISADDFGRVAAQTAKQVVVQKIREAERGIVFDDFKDRQGEIVTGIVQRKSGSTLFVDIGSTEGILPAKEQVPGERFNINDRLKAYIMDVKRQAKGPQVFLSRSHPGLVKRLFELEVPEIQDGTVEIKGIAREAGSRTKIAVATEFEDVDPVGACVGTRGNRVQAVVDELSGEKIDIIAWSDDPEELIANVLSPAKVEEVFIDEEQRIATAIVPDYQLSLAIGKEGQNVRLAAKVSGWKIDIKSHSQYYGTDEEPVIGDLRDAFEKYGDVQGEDAPDDQEYDEPADEAALDAEPAEETAPDAEPADTEPAEEAADENPAEEQKSEDNVE